MCSSHILSYKMEKHSFNTCADEGTQKEDDESTLIAGNTSIETYCIKRYQISWRNPHMYVCMYICMYACMFYVCKLFSIYVWIYFKYVWVCINEWVYVCMYALFLWTVKKSKYSDLTCSGSITMASRRFRVSAYCLCMYECTYNMTWSMVQHIS